MGNQSFVQNKEYFFKGEFLWTFADSFVSAFDRLLFQPFSYVLEKNEKNIRIRILKFLPNEPSNSALLRSSNFELFSVKFYEKNGNI